jgi:hypothetical protein
MDSAATRPWLCPRTDCPAGTHDTYSAYRRGCRSGAAGWDKYLYAKRHKVGTAQPRLVSSVGIARRIQACHYTGYTGVEIGAELGVSRRRVNELQRMDRGQVRVSTIPRMAPVLEALAMRPAPDEIRNKYMRTWARGQGFRPLLAWDDIDDPDEQPSPPVVEMTQHRPSPMSRTAPPIEIDEFLLESVLAARTSFVELSVAEQDHIVERLWRDAVAEGYEFPGRRVAERLEVDYRKVESVRGRIQARRTRERQAS